MTKYVISGYIGFDNFGDEAIAGVLTNYLLQKEDNEITVISANPKKTSEMFGVKAVKFLDFVKPIFKSDILISGGGSLLQDVTSLKSLIYYLTIIVTALVLGKKVIIFAQGFTPFRTKIGKLLTQITLKFCHKITVRDEQSKALLDSIGIKSEVVDDPVWGINIIKENEHNGIGIQLRSFENLNDDFLEKLADKIAEHFKTEEIKLFSLQDSIDLPILYKFAGLIYSRGCRARVYKNMSAPEVINEISGLEYLIGMRFHACLAAAKAGVKILGINYDIKVKNLADSVGFPIINMFGCEIDSGIKDLFAANPADYKIPKAVNLDQIFNVK